MLYTIPGNSSSVAASLYTFVSSIISFTFSGRMFCSVTRSLVSHNRRWEAVPQWNWAFSFVRQVGFFSEHVVVLKQRRDKDGYSKLRQKQSVQLPLCPFVGPCKHLDSAQFSDWKVNTTAKATKANSDRCRYMNKLTNLFFQLNKMPLWELNRPKFATQRETFERCGQKFVVKLEHMEQKNISMSTLYPSTTLLLP